MLRLTLHKLPQAARQAGLGANEGAVDVNVLPVRSGLEPQPHDVHNGSAEVQEIVVRLVLILTARLFKCNAEFPLLSDDLVMTRDIHLRTFESGRDCIGT